MQRCGLVKRWFHPPRKVIVFSGPETVAGRADEGAAQHTKIEETPHKPNGVPLSQQGTPGGTPGIRRPPPPEVITATAQGAVSLFRSSRQPYVPTVRDIGILVAEMPKHRQLEHHSHSEPSQPIREGADTTF